MIRWLMNYWRQCRCEHDFLIETFDVNAEINDMLDRGKVNELVYMRCKKCGFHTKQLKY